MKNLALPLLLLAACAPPSTEPVAEASAEIVPAPGVQCVRVVASAAQVFSQTFPVVPASGKVALKPIQLPIGATTVQADAFDEPCASVHVATPPSWIADTVTLDVFAGTNVKLDLVFRRNTPGSGTGTFVEAAAAVSLGGAGASGFLTQLADGSVRRWATGPGKPMLPLTTGIASPIVQLASGDQHACARHASGTVSCWGANASGQLGDGTNQPRVLPALVFGLSDAIHLAAGPDHSCAVHKTGAVSCWGANGAGQLGDNTTVARNKPVKVLEPIGAVVQPVNWAAQGSAGDDFSCLVWRDGAVSCWGNDSFGQLGNGLDGSTLMPTTFVDIAAVARLDSNRFQTCATRFDGLVRCWGLGADVADTGLEPAPIPGEGVVETVVADDVSCALLADGGVRCWGQNYDGAAGVGHGDPVSVPTSPLGLSGVVDLDAAGANVCAVLETGDLACWGANQHGQIDDTFIEAYAPRVVVVK
jgi:hypothetical protein